MGCFLLLACWFSLSCGYVFIPWNKVPALLYNGLIKDIFPSRFVNLDQNIHSFILIHLRGVRIIAAAIIGAGLAVSGALTQSIFRNSLAEPGFVGISSGVAMGTLLALFITNGHSTPQKIIPFVGFLVGIGVVSIVYKLGRLFSHERSFVIILTGVAVNALSAAIIGLILALANNEILRDFTFWTLGSLMYLSWCDIIWLVFLVGIPCTIAYGLSHGLNVLLFGDIEARMLGWNSISLQRAVLFLLAAIIGSSVAICGTIGFIGLIVPHAIRRIFGADHKILLIGSAFTGAILLVLADLMSRTLLPGGELPIGVFTALLGGPTLLLILYTTRNQKTDS